MAITTTSVALSTRSLATEGDAVPQVRNLAADSSTPPTAEDRNASTRSPTVALPRAVSATEVPYPEGASGNARVVLGILVDIDGSVAGLERLEGDEPFAGAALVAAKSWRFSPALIDGEPRSARIRFEVVFSQSAAESSTASDDTARPAPARSSSRSETPAPPLEVHVHGDRTTRATALSRTEVRQLPGAFGDPFRAVEALPGVTPIASGLPYFFVRGAPPGNVGYFFDGVRVPALYHIALGPSVLHPAFVGEVELYPGPYPARYGRFAGGIVAADATAPTYAWHAEGSVRLYDAGAMFEAPFAGGRGNAMLAGRYSYTAALISLIAPEVELSYWDYQGLVRYDVSSDDTFSVFAFGAADFLGTEQRGGRQRTLLDLAFHRVDLRYDHKLGESGNLRLATTLGDDNTGADDQPVRARARLVRVRAEVAEQLGTAELRAGADAERTEYAADIDESRVNQDEEGGLEAFRAKYSDRADFTLGTYAEAALSLTRHVTLSPGVRFDFYETGNDSAIGFSPRIEAAFEVSKSVYLKHGVGVADQPPSFLIPLPGIQPSLGEGLQRSLQSSAGVTLGLPLGFEATLTGFQSLHLNTSDALGVSRLDNGDPNVNPQTRTLGNTRGLELLLKRHPTQRLGLHLAYTLSRSERALGRAEGPSSFDRTHVLHTALTYDLGRRWRAGARATLYTGIPADVAYLDAARHPPRTDPFFRLDWRLEKRWLFESGAWWSLVFEVLNTTLAKEMINKSCSAYRCRDELIGPITLPSVGLEGGI